MSNKFDRMAMEIDRLKVLLARDKVLLDMARNALFEFNKENTRLTDVFVKLTDRSKYPEDVVMVASNALRDPNDPAAL